MRASDALRGGGTLVLCTLIILLPALVNGFPFVYSDTGTYLRSAFDGYVPDDRPYWYGVFIRLTSLNGQWLWGTVVVQAILCALCVIRLLLRTPHLTGLVWKAPLITTVLTLFTGIGWYAGQLIPDVFTGIGLVSVFLLLSRQHGALMRAFDEVMILLACWTHLSNLLILPLAAAAMLWMMRREKGLRPGRQWLLGIGVSVFAWMGLAAANRWVAGPDLWISRGSHAFLMGRMLDTGMLKPYLDEHCPQEHFGICAFKDSLPPHSEAFLWWPDSPLAKQGGFAKTKEEYGRIVRGSLTEPRFLLWHARGSIVSTASQLCTWEICRGLRSGWYRTPDGPPYQMIRDHLPHELPAYLGSLQNGGRGELDMSWPDLLYRIGLAASLLIAIGWLVLTRRDNAAIHQRRVIRAALVAIIIGAWVCASLSVVDSRYLGRDSWLLPLALCLAFVHRQQAMAARAGDQGT